MRLTSGRSEQERGATLVEFAIVVPLLLVLLFGIVESGRLVAEFTSIRTAAREGARYATTVEVADEVPNYRSCARIIEAAYARSVFGTIESVTVEWEGPGYNHSCSDGSQVDASQTDFPDGTEITVTVESEFRSLIPLIGSAFDGISLTTSQSRQIFIGEATT